MLASVVVTTVVPGPWVVVAVVVWGGACVVVTGVPLPQSEAILESTKDMTTRENKGTQIRNIYS